MSEKHDSGFPDWVVGVVWVVGIVADLVAELIEDGVLWVREKVKRWL